MRVRLTERKLRKILRESLQRVLLEEYQAIVNDDIYKSLALQCERFGIEFSQYWLAAAAIAYGNRDYNRFVDYLIASTTAGGIDQIFMNKKGEEWYAKPDDATREKIVKQLQARIDLVDALNSDLKDTAALKVRKLLSAEGDPVEDLSDEVKTSIQAFIDENRPNAFQKKLANFAKALRKDAVLGPISYDTHMEVLKDRGNIQKALGKLVIITPPKDFSDMSPEEQSVFADVPVAGRDKYGSPETTYPLEKKIIEQWSKVPEAEIIAIMTDNTASPLGLAYVLPTVVKDFETLKQENYEVAEWNEELLEATEGGFVGNSAWPGDYSPIRALKWADVFSGDPNENPQLNRSWKYALFQSDETLTQFKGDLSRALINVLGQPDAARYDATRFIIVDLRATLPPNKVYTAASLETSAKFECPSDTTAEMIELAFTDLSEDINVACKIAISDSLVINGSVALLQIAQLAIPKIIGGMLGAQFAAGGAALTPEFGGAGAIPAAAVGYAEGEAIGRIINAFLVVIENTLSQIYPLLYGTVYFARKKMLDIAGILLTRAVIQIGFTILQVCNAEFGIAAKRFGYPAFIQQLSKMPGWTEILVNIAGIIIDFWLSIEQVDMLLPGTKQALIAQVKGILLPYKDEEFTQDTMQKIKTSIETQRVQDLLGIEKLFLAFEQLRITRKNKK